VYINIVVEDEKEVTSMQATGKRASALTAIPISTFRRTKARRLFDNNHSLPM
jgi:hypothetical protein